MKSFGKVLEIEGKTMGDRSEINWNSNWNPMERFGKCVAKLTEIAGNPLGIWWKSAGNIWEFCKESVGEPFGNLYKSIGNPVESPSSKAVAIPDRLVPKRIKYAGSRPNTIIRCWIAKQQRIASAIL